MITKPALEKALPTLLRPIVRLCLRYAVKITEFENILKTIFIQEANQIILSSGETPSMSKISIMTGIQRHSIDKGIGKTSSPPQRPLNLVMKILGAWQGRDEYTTTTKKPRIISVEGKNSEFAQLVFSVSQSLNPYTVLFELERAKLVERTPRGLKLASASFVIRENVEETLNFLASDIEDLAHSVEENINSANGPCNHHLTTEFDNIPESKVSEIQKLILEEGNKIHARMRSVLSEFDQDTSRPKKMEKSFRVAFCSFSRKEESQIPEGDI